MFIHYAFIIALIFMAKYDLTNISRSHILR